MKFGAFVLAILVLLLGATNAEAGKRVALVMGNGAYAHAPVLANPASDARAMAAALERLGFDVELGVDLDLAGMRRAVLAFARKLQGADMALFFYAGHGLQVNGQNYLLPVDATIGSEADLDFSAMPARLVLDQMDRWPAVKIVILDACRDNPFETALSRSMGSTRSAKALSRGLAPIETAGGTLLAYATDPGDVASDGAGGNSPFTQALLKHVETPGLEINTMLARVRADVFDATGHQQRPWTETSLIGEFYLAPAAPEAPPVTAAMMGAAGAGRIAAAVEQARPAGRSSWRSGRRRRRAARRRTIANTCASIRTASSPSWRATGWRRCPGRPRPRAIRSRRPNRCERGEPCGEPCGGATERGRDPRAARAARDGHRRPSNPRPSDRRRPSRSWPGRRRRRKRSHPTRTRRGRPRRPRRRWRWTPRSGARCRPGCWSPGHDPRGVDGIFGPGTRAALSAWQTAEGLEATGYLTRPRSSCSSAGRRRTTRPGSSGSAPRTRRGARRRAGAHRAAGGAAFGCRARASRCARRKPRRLSKCPSREAGPGR